jgi:alkylation response protein AidB-like acyl-CoA dehydrogenase
MSGRELESEADARFRAEARAFLEANAKRRSGAGDWSRGPRVHTPEAEYLHFERCRAWQRTLYDHGFAGLTWPREHGGRGATAAQALIFAEEAEAFDVTSGFLASAIDLVAPALLHHGSEAQRRRYMRPLLRGDEVWCQLFSEPEAGSDLASLRMRAVRDGDAFVIDGQKLWTSSAQFCDFGILLARTSPDAPKHRGISFFLVDMRSPGISVRRCPPRPAAATSTRCSSTACACRRTRSSESSTAAGRSRARPWRTSRRRSAPPRTASTRATRWCGSPTRAGSAATRACARRSRRCSCASACSR